MLAGTVTEADGSLAPNLADLSQANADGTFDEPTTINYNGAAGDIGDFTGDRPIPGLPGITGSTDNDAMEIITYIDFPAVGMYTMGFNSDDGFRTTAMYAPGDTERLNVGEFDGGRGSSDTLYNVLVTKPGLYPFRTIWENGGGDLNLEWFTVNADGSKSLINDANDANALKAYRVLKTNPAILQSVSAQASTFTVALADAGQSVTASSVSATLDGQPITVTATKTGSVTTIAATLSGPLDSNSTHDLVITYTAGGTSFTRDITLTDRKSVV